MNTGKSIKIFMVKTDKDHEDLANDLGISKDHVSKICRQKTCGGKMLVKLCEVFNVKASEFIAAGE